MSESDHPYRFRSVSATHPGAIRTLNEDSFLENPAAGLWVVADGVGGHAAGDYASQAVVAGLDRIGKPDSAATLFAAVRRQLDITNANLRARAANEGIGTIATTVAALLCFARHYAAAWAGDSRIYLWRDSILRLVTRDHTAVQELVEAGAITPEDARSHPNRNVITRAVGADSTLELEMVHDRVQPRDIFLLCSDGLGKVVSDAEIAEALRLQPGETVPNHLVQMTLARGAPDNVTIVLVECLDEAS